MKKIILALSIPIIILASEYKIPPKAIADIVVFTKADKGQPLAEGSETFRNACSAATFVLTLE